MKIFLSLIMTVFIAYSCNDKLAKANDKALFENIDVTSAKKLITENPDMIILDVRTPGETKNGTLPNAIKIDFKNSNFQDEINKLDKNKSYLVYCKSGGRSVGACKKMKAAGFTKLINMKGGYSSWK